MSLNTVKAIMILNAKGWTEAARAKARLKRLRKHTRTGVVALGGGASRPATAADFKGKNTEIRKAAARRLLTQRKLYPEGAAKNLKRELKDASAHPLDQYKTDKKSKKGKK